MVRPTAIVFGDLEHYGTELALAQSSPAQVRRLFKHFVLQTQQLTDAMRKEFKGLTGERWEAKRFLGWNDTTSLFKILRNTESHETTVTLRVDLEASFFEEVVLRVATNEEVMIREFGEDSPDNRRCISGGLVIRQVIDVGDPFADQNTPLAVSFCDPETGEPLPESLQPYRLDATYHLIPCTHEVAAALSSLDTDDVHTLVRRSLPVYAEYFRFYLADLAKRGH